MESEEGAAAMAHDGVRADTFVMLVEALRYFPGLRMPR